MTLTNTERRHLSAALSSAIQWEDSLADAYRTAYPKRFTGVEQKIVPIVDRPIVARCKRRIKMYRALQAKLRSVASRKQGDS